MRSTNSAAPSLGPPPPRRSYVYAIVVDGVVRYVGKGTGGRKDDHFRQARRIIREGADLSFTPSVCASNLAVAIQSGSDVSCRIVASDLGEQAAYDLERRLIARLRNGLWNKSPGGKGFTSDAAKRARKMVEQQFSCRDFLDRRAAAIGASLRERFERNPEEAVRLSNIQRRAWRQPGAREKRVAGMVAYRRLPTGIKARVLAAVGNGATLEEIAHAIPDRGRRAIISTIHKLKRSGEITKEGGKYDGLYRQTTDRRRS